MYFAGEGFSVQGGWIEPALRGALDAVIYLVHNNGGEFRGGFEFGKYPQYDYKNPPNAYGEHIARICDVDCIEAYLIAGDAN